MQYIERYAKHAEFNGIELELVGYWIELVGYYKGNDGNFYSYHTNGFSSGRFVNQGPKLERVRGNWLNGEKINKG